MTEQEKKDSYIAAGITLLILIVIILLLIFCGITYQEPEPKPKDTTPELLMEEEETFLEPEILKDLGEENAVNNDAPAQAFQGEPKPAPVENTKLVTPGKNPKPAPPVDKLVSTKHESDMKSTEPTVTEEERQQVTSAMAKSFSGRNGTPQGSSGSDGAGGTGVGVKGNAAGRTFLSCPSPSVTLRHQTSVTVTVVIDADGKVTSASASGGASAEIRRACENAARQARWSAKKGASETRGSITFKIYPR